MANHGAIMILHIGWLFGKKQHNMDYVSAYRYLQISLPRVKDAITLRTSTFAHDKRGATDPSATTFSDEGGISEII